MADHPAVRHEWPARNTIGDAVLEGTCQDTAFVVTDKDDCDVCLLVDQDCDISAGRHALMRMDAAEAVTLGKALVAAGRNLTQPVPGNSGGVEEGDGWPQKPTLPELVAATIQRARGFEDEARPLANMLPNGANDDRIFEARGKQQVAENLRELLEEPTAAASTQPPSPQAANNSSKEGDDA